jgi:hypothetical protein
MCCTVLEIMYFLNSWSFFRSTMLFMWMGLMEMRMSSLDDADDEDLEGRPLVEPNGSFDCFNSALRDVSCFMFGV